MQPQRTDPDPDPGPVPVVFVADEVNLLLRQQADLHQQAVRLAAAPLTARQRFDALGLTVIDGRKS